MLNQCSKQTGPGGSYPGQAGPEQVGGQQLDQLLNHAGAARLALQPLPGEDDPPDDPVGGRAHHISKGVHGLLPEGGGVA